MSPTSPECAPLRVAGVSKRYGRAAGTQALDGVSLEVGAGEVVALLGNNGAGKTTLMSICAGLLSADAGQVFVEGRETTADGGTPSPDLGLAPQDEAVYPTLTTRQNLRYFGRLSGLRGRELDGRTVDVARHLSIDDLLDRKARDLSGGQRRRLHTGLALMHRPTVLLLDEPTVGVDVDARAELLEFVRATARAGAAILYSTHQLHEVEALDARVVIIDGGRVLARGSVGELVARYAPPVAELRFDRADPELPADLASSVDLASTTPAGELRVVLRLPHAGTHVADVIASLPDATRRCLVGADVPAPSLEQAYLRIVRASPGASGATTTGDIQVEAG